MKISVSLGMETMFLGTQYLGPYREEEEMLINKSFKECQKTHEKQANKNLMERNKTS